MGLDPSRVVGCAGAQCQKSFTLANGFAVEAVVAEKREGVMNRSQLCKHQVCDYCGECFDMLTQPWWGNKFCKSTAS
jgi:hypothetical protein